MQQQQQPPPMQAPKLQVAYGGSARAREEEAQRSELLAGATPGTAPAGGSSGLRPLADYDAMNNEQLADHAVSQHKETTASAKRSLAVSWFRRPRPVRARARATNRAATARLMLSLSAVQGTRTTRLYHWYLAPRPRYHRPSSP